MANYNITERQQFDEVKRWFKENGLVISLALIVGVGSVLGWRFWQNHQVSSAQAASTQYQIALAQYEADPAKNKAAFAQFAEQAKGTAYSVFARLELAKNAVNQNQFDEAKQQLTAALNEADEENVKAIITLRLAQVEFQLKQFDSAIALLDGVNNDAWKARKLTLKGDILVAKGDKAGAKAAYTEAKAALPAEAQAVLEMKLNNL